MTLKQSVRTFLKTNDIKVVVSSPKEDHAIFTFKGHAWLVKQESIGSFTLSFRTFCERGSFVNTRHCRSQQEALNELMWHMQRCNFLDYQTRNLLDYPKESIRFC